jgi:hypothetical protein
MFQLMSNLSQQSDVNRWLIVAFIQYSYSGGGDEATGTATLFQ